MMSIKLRVSLLVLAASFCTSATFVQAEDGNRAARQLDPWSLVLPYHYQQRPAQVRYPYNSPFRGYYLPSSVYPSVNSYLSQDNSQPQQEFDSVYPSQRGGYFKNNKKNVADKRPSTAEELSSLALQPSAIWMAEGRVCVDPVLSLLGLTTTTAKPTTCSTSFSSCPTLPEFSAKACSGISDNGIAGQTGAAGTAVITTAPTGRVEGGGPASGTCLLTVAVTPPYNRIMVGCTAIGSVIIRGISIVAGDGRTATPTTDTGPGGVNAIFSTATSSSASVTFRFENLPAGAFCRWTQLQ